VNFFKGASRHATGITEGTSIMRVEHRDVNEIDHKDLEVLPSYFPQQFMPFTERYTRWPIPVAPYSETVFCLKELGMRSCNVP
jgi:hypothetical protein